MSFTALQQEQATEKFLMIRVKPTRLLNDSLTLVSGTTYTANFSYAVNSIFENGIELNEVSGTPSTGEYSISNGVITMNFTAAPSTTNSITVDYFVFFTQSRVRVERQDPTLSSGPLREWEPRIEEEGGFGQDISNILNGVFTITTSEITLINNEAYFEQYFSINDSWNKKEIEIWQCLNSVENIQGIFKGKISAATLDRRSLFLTIQDDFGDLNKPALLGDTTVYYTNDSFTAVNPNIDGDPIPFIFGTASRYRLLVESVTSYDGYKLDFNSLYSCRNINYTETIDTANNRDWGICRISSNGLTDFSFTPSVIDSSPAQHQVLTGTAAEIAKFKIGATFEDSSGGHHRVLDIPNTTQLIITKLNTFSGSVLGNLCPSLVFYKNTNGQDYPLYYGRDYTASTSTTEGGNLFLEITLVDNFEATLSVDPLDPSIDQLRFRVQPEHTAQGHAEVLEYILIKSGLDVNTASFAATQAELDVNANFSIPYFDEGDFGDVTNYAQLLLQSTFGYIYLNNSFELEYGLFNTPSTGTTITDVDIIEDTYSIEINYEDIVTKIISFNPHASSIEFSTKTSITEESNAAFYLHGINNVTRFRHVLEDISTRLSDILAVRSNRIATYRFTSKQLNYNSVIGEDVTLQKSGILGNETTKSMTMLGLNKETNQTVIKAIDLLNI